MELSNENKKLLSLGIANVVTECIKNNKVDVIFIDVVKNKKQSTSQIINLSVVYNQWISSKEQDEINALIVSLQEKTGLNILLDYKFSGDYCLNYLSENDARYYRICLGEILYENGERFTYYQEISRRHSKQGSQVVDVLSIPDIKKRVLAKQGIPLAS